MPFVARPKRRVPLASLSVTSAAGSPSGPQTLKDLQTLPVFERTKDGHTRQFAISGKSLCTISTDQSKADGKAQLHRPVQFINRTKQRLREAFFPVADGVSEEYYLYCKWRFAQRIASSALSVIATQQMLFAVGLGAKRALPTAAALNWVLKDGLGRLGKLTVATRFGHKFDADIKRFRFTSSVVYDTSAGIEILTPLFPQQFLLLATIANVGKSIGVTTANVVRAPIQMSFSLKANLADIAARTSAQQVLADNLGLAAAVAMVAFVRNMPRARAMLPFALYPILSSVDLFCIHKELQNVQLKTINKERGEIIANFWVEHKHAPTFKDVAQEECILLPPTLEEGSLPCIIGPLSSTISSVEELRGVLTRSQRVTGAPSRYILTYRSEQEVDSGLGANCGRVMKRVADSFSAKKRKKARWRGHAMLSLPDDYQAADVLTALLQVAHLRKLPFRSDLTADAARRWAMEESLARAKRDYPAFVADITAQGWQSHQVLMSSAERVTFHVNGGMQALTKELVSNKAQ